MKNNIKYFVVILFMSMFVSVYGQGMGDTDPASVDLMLYSNMTDITVYQAVEEQTDSDFLITASGYQIQNAEMALTESVAAVSRDLLGDYPFGSRILLQCACPYNDMIFSVQDVMNKRYKNTIDILIGYNDDIGKWRGSIIKLYNN